jgi:hypothetical protein
LIVDYPEVYRGVRFVVGHGNESVGVVKKRHQKENQLNAAFSDSFNQIDGI